MGIDYGFAAPKFSVGDLITVMDKQHPLFRRDCHVVYSDEQFMGVMTEGIMAVVFLSQDDPTLVSLKAGAGKLTEAQTELIKQVMANWGSIEIVRELPKFLSMQQGHTDSKDQKEYAHIHLGGFISKELVRQWREFNALLMLAQTGGVAVPENIERYLMEWMVISTMNLPSILKVFREVRNLKQIFGDEEDIQNP